MKINYKINELFNLLAVVFLNDNDLINTPKYPEINKVSRELISLYGLPEDENFLKDFIAYAYEPDINQEPLNDLLQF